jgi:hypothetical protein
MPAVEKLELVEMRAIKPLCGTFQTSLADAEWTEDIFIDGENGMAVKSKVGRRRFIGLIPVTRSLTVVEIEAALRGELEERIEVLDQDALASIRPGATSYPRVACIEHPRERTFRVPEAIAANLEQRGLAERAAVKR